MGFERNYQIRIPSNQINKQVRFYSSKVISQYELELNKVNMSWFFSGLVDAEGCFTISITRDKKNKVGWGVKLIFKIVLHKKDKALLEQIQSFLGVGGIYQDGNCLQYRVESIKDLPKVIKFFDEYQLITKKRADYLLFKLAINLVLNKEHITMEGLNKIVAIKASMNKSLSSKLKDAFPNILPVERPLVLDLPIPDPQWLAGFTSGEGCFSLLFINQKILNLEKLFN